MKSHLLRGAALFALTIPCVNANLLTEFTDPADVGLYATRVYNAAGLSLPGTWLHQPGPVAGMNGLLQSTSPNNTIGHAVNQVPGVAGRDFTVKTRFSFGTGSWNRNAGIIFLAGQGDPASQGTRYYLANVDHRGWIGLYSYDGNSGSPIITPSAPTDGEGLGALDADMVVEMTVSGAYIGGELMLSVNVTKPGGATRTITLQNPIASPLDGNGFGVRTRNVESGASNMLVNFDYLSVATLGGEIVREFKITSFSYSPAEVTLAWQSEANQFYNIEESENLSVWNKLKGVASEGEYTSTAVAPTAFPSGKGFYRVKLGLPDP